MPLRRFALPMYALTLSVGCAPPTTMSEQTTQETTATQPTPQDERNDLDRLRDLCPQMPDAQITAFVVQFDIFKEEGIPATEISAANIEVCSSRSDSFTCIICLNGMLDAVYFGFER